MGSKEQELSALELLKTQLAALTESMKPTHLSMAISIAQGKTQEQAYKDSGGKAKNPSNSATLLIQTNPSISNYVATAKAIASLESQEQLVATVAQKRAALWEVKQRCLDEVKPVFEGYGEDKKIVGYTFDARGVIGSIAELNKMDGDLAPSKTINKTQIVDDLSDLMSEIADGATK